MFIVAAVAGAFVAIEFIQIQWKSTTFESSSQTVDDIIGSSLLCRYSSFKLMNEQFQSNFRAISEQF